MSYLRHTFTAISFGAAALVIQSPAADAAPKGIEYEAHYEGFSADFTDCPISSDTYPIDCSALLVSARHREQQAGRAHDQDSLGFVTSFAIHLTGPVEFTATPIASGDGPVIVDASGIRGSRVKGRVTLDDGSVAKFDIVARASGTPFAYSGTFSDTNDLCPSGSLTADYKGKQVDVSVTGVAKLNAISMTATPVVFTPNIFVEEQKGLCAP